MIKLEKKGTPPILSENELSWTKVLEDKLSRGQNPTEAEKSRYRHPDIKAALIEETSGKCAYCESKLLHVTFGDVEHIAPKSLALENLFKWNNLTLACDRCNTYKSNNEDIVDPYTDDPEQIFVFWGALVLPHPGLEKAVLTEKLLKLNRGDLMERRLDKVKRLHDQLAILSKTRDPKLREILKADLLINETDGSQEFAAVARSFLSMMLPKTTNGLCVSA